MRKSILFVSVLLAAFSACTGTQNCPDENRADRILAELNNPKSKNVLVVSHRGDWRNYPENSIDAINSAIEQGADIIEIDLKLTKDSVLILCHDKTLNRTSTGKGQVSDYTLAEIKQLRLKRAHGVATDSTRFPTLKEALEVCKGRALVNVDHAQNYYKEVIEVTEELGMTGYVLMKGKKPHAVVESEMAPYEHNLLYMPIIDIYKPAGQELFAEYMDNGIVPIAYEVCWRDLDEQTLDCMNKVVSTGSKLWANTLWSTLNGGLDDDAAFEQGADKIYGKVVDLGATMIQTDRVEFLVDYLRSRGLHE